MSVWQGWVAVFVCCVCACVFRPHLKADCCRIHTNHCGNFKSVVQKSKGGWHLWLIFPLCFLLQYAFQLLPFTYQPAPLHIFGVCLCDALFLLQKKKNWLAHSITPLIKYYHYSLFFFCQHSVNNNNNEACNMPVDWSTQCLICHSNNAIRAASVNQRAEW